MSTVVENQNRLKEKPLKSTTAVVLFAGLFIQASLQAQTRLNVARFDEDNALAFPEHTDEWVHLGSSLGGEYGAEPFDPADPGTLGVVQMEPQAYRYFKEHGEYADGSMFLLSFYISEAESDPQLPGFVQGDMDAQEIHIIDSRFNEGRGFFLYPSNAGPGTASSKLPDGSNCFVCHMAEGDYNGTFTQFYPPIRSRMAE